MNRIYSVLLAVTASCTGVFAQFTNVVGTGSETIGFTNLHFYGEAGIPSANIEKIAKLQVKNSVFIGGDDDQTNQMLNQNGSTGLRVDSVNSINLEASDFKGGKGGNRQAVTAGLSKANGGAGVETLGETSFDLLNEGVVATGGDGGAVSFSTGESQALGGNGISIDSFLNENLNIVGGLYQGGTGGSAAMSEGADLQLFQTRGANGGHGIFLGNILGTFADTIKVSGGNFIGGDGGSATNALGSVFADGGSGLYIKFANDVQVSGGNFGGGAAGFANGIQGAVGNGLRTLDVANLSITGGEFIKNSGVLLESLSLPESNISISDGQFSVAEFRATKFFISGNLINTPANIVSVSGGAFEEIILSGDSENRFNVSGMPSLGRLQISGTGVNNISFISDAVFVDGVIQSQGTANINQWNNSHFANTKIYSGTMNFNGQIFEHGDGETMTLFSQGSMVDFKGGLLAKSNSVMAIAFDGTNTAKIAGSTLTFEEGAKVVVNGGDSVVATGQKITLAEATVALNASTNVNYIDYVGTGGSWLGGITSLSTASKKWVGTYGYVSIEKALDLDPNSDFGMAMADLSAITGISSSGDNDYLPLKTLSEAAATATLMDGYVRAPEMASTLIQLQGVFADQVKDRSRSYLRHKKWGEAMSSAPQGAQGPAWDNSMDWLNSHLPKWDVRGVGKMDKQPKKASVHAKKAKIGKIEVPSTYQAWGRGYGSRIEQDATTGFGGYNADVGGVVLGFDKHFNNLLVGLGGGYAHTTVDGNWGSDGEADTGYGMLYAAFAGEKTFIDFNVNYALNDVETTGSPVMQYSGDYKASTVGIYIGAGLGLDWGKWLFAPEASLLTTYYTQEDYAETSASADLYPTKNWDSYSDWSYLSSVGATLSMMKKIDSLNLEMGFQPEFRLHWLHEFNADMDNPTYMMVGGANIIDVTLQSREENLIKVGTGVRFSKWESDTLEFGIDLDGAFGSDYAAYVISGKLMHRF